jgi:hypothetical protein
MNTTYMTRAQDNLLALRNAAYSGRGFVLARLETGEVAMIYWIGGRSPGSRNRVFLEEGGRLYTEIADRSKLKPNEDTSLTIYNAMDTRRGYAAVTNGKQTDDIINRVESGSSLDKVLRMWKYEPDQLHTPRISGLYVTPQAVGSGMEQHPFQISLLRKAPDDDSCMRSLWKYHDIPAGYGYCITTYEWSDQYAGTDGAVSSYHGEPVLVPVQGASREVLDTYVDVLNATTRVAVAIKVIGRGGSEAIFVKNENQLVAQAAA